MLIKALFRRYFSLWIFIFTQIFTDFETLYFLIIEEPPVHRLLHTYVGANITVAVAVFFGRPIYNGGLWIWDRLRKNSAPAVPRLGWGVTLTSAVIGSYSHVLLDSIMHSDAQPFKPFSAENPALWMVSLNALLAFCVISGFCGAMLWGGCFLRSSRRMKLIRAGKSQ